MHQERLNQTFSRAVRKSNKPQKLLSQVDLFISGSFAVKICSTDALNLKWMRMIEHLTHFTSAHISQNLEGFRACQTRFLSDFFFDDPFSHSL